MFWNFLCLPTALACLLLPLQNNFMLCYVCFPLCLLLNSSFKRDNCKYHIFFKSNQFMVCTWNVSQVVVFICLVWSVLSNSQNLFFFTLNTTTRSQTIFHSSFLFIKHWWRRFIWSIHSIKQLEPLIPPHLYKYYWKNTSCLPLNLFQHISPVVDCWAHCHVCAQQPHLKLIEWPSAKCGHKILCLNFLIRVTEVHSPVTSVQKNLCNYILLKESHKCISNKSTNQESNGKVQE